MIKFFKSIYKKLDCFAFARNDVALLQQLCHVIARTASPKQSSLFLLIFIAFASPSFAFQDCVITNDGKLTDISIEDNKMIDVFPLITVMNEKNTLIVHPLKEGSTRFCVLKNNKNIVMFNIKISKNETCIDEVEGFDILPIDTPDGNYDDEVFELDKPWTN